MEKSEGRKKPGNSPSHRAYSLFSSIINLSTSQGVKTTDVSSPPQSTHSSPITSTNHHHQLHQQKQQLQQQQQQPKPKQKQERVSSASSSSNVSKKRKSNQSSSTSSQSIASQGSSPSTTNVPMGPAPRTLSILTALNDLANSSAAAAAAERTAEQTGGLRTNSHNDLTHPQQQQQHHPSRVNINPNLFPSRLSSSHHQLSSSSSSHSTSTAKLKRDDLPSLPSSSSSSSISFSNSIPRRKLQSTDHFSTDNHNLTHPHLGAKTRSKSKDRTPDWITKIFQQAKHGRLDELQQSLKGLDPMDPTLLRHLVDGKGNTLLHYAARGGHVLTLQWLVSILGPHTEAVLSDKNRAGRNVILTALKGGQLQCFQWLVLHTTCGDKGLVPMDGEGSGRDGKSLLHFAASYGNDEAVKWLAEQLKTRNIELSSIKDSVGLTPLHMGGKSGSLPVCHELIAAGASPLCQTELGLRPSDLALRHHHKECANYLMMAEAADSLGQELFALLDDHKTLGQEHDSLRSNFREVLRVGKWLVKERVDLIKSFPSLTSKSSPEATLLLGGASGNGTRFSGLEHKLVRAEQDWKKMEQNQSQGKEGKFLSSIARTKSLENLNDPNLLLQKRLGDLESRCRTNFTSNAYLSGSSSSDENSGSDMTSSEDDHHSRHRHPLTSTPPSSSQPSHLHHHHGRHHSRQPGQTKQSVNNSFQRNNSTTAPWLLPPDDSLLSALTPIVSQMDVSSTSVGTPVSSVSTVIKTTSSSSSSVMMEMIPNLDLLRIAPSSPSSSTSSPSAANSSLLSKPGFGGGGTGGKNESSEYRLNASLLQQQQQSPMMQVYEDPTPAAAVLEVIEPHRTPTKAVYFTPDLIRGTRHKDEKPKVHSSSPSTSTTAGCDTHPNMTPISKTHSMSSCTLENIYGELKSTTTSSRCPDFSLRPNFSKSNQQQHQQTGTNSNSSKIPWTTRGSDMLKTKMSTSCISPSTILNNNNNNSANNSMSNSPRSSSQSTFILAPEPFSLDDEDFGDDDEVVQAEGTNTNDLGHSSASPTAQTSCEHLITSSPSSSSAPHNVGGGGSSSSSPVKTVPFNLTQMGYSPILAPPPSSLNSELFNCTDSSFNQGGGGGEEEEGNSSTSTPILLHHRISSPHPTQSPLGITNVPPNDSVSSANTPVMTRSLSSSSRSSTTVLFPVQLQLHHHQQHQHHKIPWLSTELLAAATSAGNISSSSTRSPPGSCCGGRLSPSPSETSRTESALVPPSHTSQNSEVSKTESASEQQQAEQSGGYPHLERLERIDIDSMLGDEEGEHDENIDVENPGNHPDCDGREEGGGGETEEEGKGSLTNNCDYNPTVYHAGDGPSSSSILLLVGTESNHQSGQSSQCQLEMVGSGNQEPQQHQQQQAATTNQESCSSSSRCTAQPVQSAPCSIIRPRISTVKTIQRASKTARGPPKPWYEIDGSDDEEHLLRIARNSRSFCLSSSPSVPPVSKFAPPSGHNDNPINNEDISDETELKDIPDSPPPPPPTSCPPRHNSPDFV